jgi:hypothetical protein
MRIDLTRAVLWAAICCLGVSLVFAAGIRTGATMQVKHDSIWFQTSAELTRWQQLKKVGDAAAFASYQAKLLSSRDAWQFTTQLTVKVLAHDLGKNQVNVEMLTAGRMLGSTWFIDADALVQ